jgi:hypothetical protein
MPRRCQGDDKPWTCTKILGSVSFQQDSVEREDSPPPADQPARDEPRTSSRRTGYFSLARSSVIGGSAGFRQATPAVSALPTSWRPETVPVHAVTSLGQVEVALTDREKRCLAVPIDDVRDKKRKLLRCRSAVVATRTK